MNYLNKAKGIDTIVNFLKMESIIPIFGSGFSGEMPSLMGVVPMGDLCRTKMQELLMKHCSLILNKSDLEEMDFNETAKWFKREYKKGHIPEKDYVSFYRNNFTKVQLDVIRKNVLSLPWRNAYTINIDDGIEGTGLYDPIFPYREIRDDYNGMDRLYKLHGDANHEVKYRNSDNIVFDQNEYHRAMEARENETIRNNVLTAFREFNIIYIGCSLKNEPDLEWYYDCVKDEKKNTKIIYLTNKEVNARREGMLESYGVTDIITTDDFVSFYIDLVHSYNSATDDDVNFPFTDPAVETIKDMRFQRIYGVNPFNEKENRFERSDIFIERSVGKSIEDAFSRKRVVVLSGRRFSGCSSFLAQMCNTEKTRTVYYFPSTTAFDLSIVRSTLHRETPSLLLFDSNAMQPDVYLAMKDLQRDIDSNDHHVLIIETLEDTYLTESLDCEVVKLQPKFDEIELKLLNKNLDRYGLIHRRKTDTNLDYLTYLKEKQDIDFPSYFKIPSVLSDIEKQILLVLASEDKVYSRDIHLMGIKNSDLDGILSHLDRLCERVPTSRGERRSQSSFKVVHNSRALVLHLLRNDVGLSQNDVANNVKALVRCFYQNKDRMQKQIAIDIMQFDTLNEIYGRNKGAGRLIEKVYEELQEVLYRDPHYWLQRSKCIYRMNPDNVDKLKQAYQYCVKASDDDSNSDKLEAQTALSLSLISGLLSRQLDDNTTYAEQCIIKGYFAMNSVYYSSQGRARLEKERAGHKMSYEDLCLKVCDDYILRYDSDDECKNIAFKIIGILRG